MGTMTRRVYKEGFVCVGSERVTKGNGRAWEYGSIVDPVYALHATSENRSYCRGGKPTYSSVNIHHHHIDHYTFIVHSIIHTLLSRA